MTKKVKIVFGAILLAAGTASAQDFPKIESAPGFAFQHNAAVFGKQSFNCAGGGSTWAYNLTSVFAMAVDLSGCKVFGLDNTFGVGSKIGASEFTYVFGPRITFNRQGKLHPFFSLNFGGERIGASCNTGNAGNACGALSVPSTPTTPGQLPTQGGGASQLPVVIVPVRNPNATSVSQNAFALTVGGGLDLELNKRFAWRMFQTEYLYTRFGNNCDFAVCSNNNSQNSFRLKSALVISFGRPK